MIVWLASYPRSGNTFSNQNKTVVDIICNNSSRIGSWGEHVSSWDPKNRKKTLLIKFEELIKDPIQYINVIEDFLKIKPIRDKIPSFDELKKINRQFFKSGKTNSWEEVYTKDKHFLFWLKNDKVMEIYGYNYKKPKKLLPPLR